MRAQPTTRGLGVASLASRAITDPVVPQDAAATQTRTSPKNIARVVYGGKAEVSVGTIGFNGLGRMDATMARHLGAGYGLIVHDARQTAHTAAARLIEEWAGIELWSNRGDPT
jgi:hypothetical protein